MEMQDNYRPDSDLYIFYNVGTQFASIAPANPPQVREHSKKTLGQSYWSNLITSMIARSRSKLLAIRLKLPATPFPNPANR
jgi:hypothetical protein